MDAGPKQIILLTATVQPKPGTHALARVGVSDRLNDYLCAFSLYLSFLRGNPDILISFVENSGYDLAKFREMAASAGVSDCVELISYTATDSPERNRFHLEAALLRRALEVSEFLRLPSVRIWRVTGRYRVLNLLQVIRRAPSQLDMYLNFRNHPRKALDFYLAGFSRKGLEATVSRKADTYQVRETGEDILRTHVENGVFDDLIVIRRHNVVANFRGVRGFDGRSYGGWAQTSKYIMRSAANRFTPWLWI